MREVPERLNAALDGRYRVERELGAGGMAVVYLAHDLRHHRLVAIKVLRAELTQAIGAERFLREIEIAAGLTHPHILPLHDSGEADGLLFFVMPYVQGESLRERLQRERQLPLDEAVRYIAEVASALDYAHEFGIVHRDIKPDNILLSAGHAVVSDFGIARAVRAAGGARLTHTGVFVGTPAYMSPEQVSVDTAVDRRSDIYSLGCLAYELLGGEPPFSASTAQAVLARHLHDPVPRLRTLRPTVSARLEQAVERALAKTPADRFSRAADFAAALQGAVTEALPADRPRRSGLTGRRALAAAVPLALVALLTAIAVRRSAVLEKPIRVDGVAKLTWEDGIESSPSLSADGGWVAYMHAGDIYLRSVGGTVPVNLTPGVSAWDGQPAFSPDGRYIAFASRRDGGTTTGGIWITEVGGGPARRVSDAGFDPAWSPDGQEILYNTEYVVPDRPGRVRISELWAVHAQRGTQRLITDGDAITAAWSPNGHRIAYSRSFLEPRAQWDIWTMRPDGTDQRPVTVDMARDGYPVWSPDGRFLFYTRAQDAGAGIWRVRIDERTGRVMSAPKQVALPASIVAKISFAADGVRAVYEAIEFESNIWRAPFDPAAGSIAGDPVPVTSGTRVWEEVDVARDGRLVLNLARTSLHVSDADGGNMTPIPNARGDRFARWSPDGEWIAFTSGRSGNPETWITRVDRQNPQQVTDFGNAGAGFFPHWSADGSRLAITTSVFAGGHTFLMDPAVSWSAQMPDTLPAAPGDPTLRYRPWSWSRDGRHLAAYSERGAGLAVYSFDTRQWNVLTEQGERPRWLSDNQRLIYDVAGRLVLIDSRTGRTRELLSMPGVSLEAPVPAPDDRAVYFLRRRLEGDLWLATIR